MSHTSGGKVKFGLASLAAAGVLYGAVVVFGLGSGSPVALGTSDDRPTTVVRVPPHGPAVPGPVRRRPQALPGPGRRRGARDQGVSVRPGRAKPSQGARATTTPSTSPSSPNKKREILSEHPSSPGPPSVPVPSLPLPELPLPTLPLPTVTVPTVTVPSLPVPPVQLPKPPALPPLP